MIYYRMFHVPVWVVVEESERKKQVVDWLNKALALHVEWPSNTFYKTMEEMRKSGWSEYLDNEEPIPHELLLRASIEHLSKFNSKASVTPYTTFTTINKKDKTPAGYANMLNGVLLSCEPIILSQIFMVQERASMPDSYKVWYTDEPCDKNVLTRLALNVITIGEEEGCSINIKEVKSKKELEQMLEDKFIPIMQTLNSN